MYYLLFRIGSTVLVSEILSIFREKTNYKTFMMFSDVIFTQK